MHGLRWRGEAGASAHQGVPPVAVDLGVHLDPLHRRRDHRITANTHTKHHNSKFKVPCNARICFSVGCCVPGASQWCQLHLEVAGEVRRLACRPTPSRAMAAVVVRSVALIQAEAPHLKNNNNNNKTNRTQQLRIHGLRIYWSIGHFAPDVQRAVAIRVPRLRWVLRLHCRRGRVRRITAKPHTQPKNPKSSGSMQRARIVG